MDEDDDDEAMFDKFNPELVIRQKQKLEKHRAEKLRNIDSEKFKFNSEMFLHTIQNFKFIYFKVLI
jgi:hypothetical protein